MKNKFVLNKWTGGTLLAGLSLVSLSAVAQDVEKLDESVAAPEAKQPATTTAEKAEPLPITVSLGSSYQMDTDIDKDNGGSFSLARTKASIGVPWRVNDSFTWRNNFRYEYDYYNFDTSYFGNTEPWKNINTLSFASILSWRADDNWSYYGGGLLKMSAESGANLGQGTTGGGVIGFNYNFSQDLSLGLGLAAMSQIERDATILPLFMAKWKFADNWILNAGLTDVSTLGYGVDVKWLFSNEWDFTFGCQVHKSRFRIEGDASNPSSKDGIGQESSANIFADAAWHASSKVDLDFFVGMATGGKLRGDNSEGDKQWQVNYKPAAILGGKLTFRF